MCIRDRLEGAEVEVPVGANSKNAMVPLETVNTKNILFICGGAFPDLENIIKERLNKQSSIGFRADLKDKYDHEKNLIRKAVSYTHLLATLRKLLMDEYLTAIGRK